MPWIQLKINATDKNAEALGDILSDSGALSVTFLDAKDNPVFEPMPGETRLWGDTDIVALYEGDHDMTTVLTYLRAQPELGENLAYKLEPLEDKDWVREWMDQFHPMKFGQRLWICPSWRDVPDPTAVNVMLDPGLAFGTGTHPTTALCLQWLDAQDLAGKTVVDFGCGSGILAIAALKLGAKRVVGIDIDPQAITASKENARRNGVEDQIELYLPKDQPDDILGDVLVANILAGPLEELAPLMQGLVKQGGPLALSGLLPSQAERLREVYGQWFDMAPATEQDEWIRLNGLKK